MAYDDKESDALLESQTPGEDRFREIRLRFKTAQDAVTDLYSKAQDDFKFVWVDGNQWDAHLSGLRGKRPKYEFNYLRQTIKQVLNDNRQNTPQIKVRPTEDGDKENAEIRQGLIKNIESRSNADQAYDWAAMYAITAGFGCWRVTTEYAGDDTFDQDICIKRIENPFSVYFDHESRDLNRADARFLFIVEDIPKSEFRRRWPDAEIKTFESGVPSGSYYGDWYRTDTVRIAEYWCKHRKTKTIYKLSNGKVVDAEQFDLVADQAANPPIGPDGQPMAEPITITSEREVEYDEITVEILSGDETLEGPTKWVGKHFGVIPVWGDLVSVDGQEYWYGMARPSKDAQTLINFTQSNLVEVVANQPKAPFLATNKMVEGNKNQWERMAVDNPPVLFYTPDPLAAAQGGMPSRIAPPTMTGEWFSLNQQNVENLKSTSGVHDASLGRQSNETSGRAILARQHEGDVANYDYMDNIARAIQWTGVVVNDLIDKIYTTERDIRVLGEAETEKYIKINQPVYDPVARKWTKVNDITTGKYDIDISVGPSFATQRMETLTALTELARGGGPLAPVYAWAILDYMDTPGIDKFAEIARKMLIAQGFPVDPEEGDQPPAPPQPNPKDVADAQKAQADAAKAQAQTGLIAQQTQAVSIENQERGMNLQAQQAGMQIGMSLDPRIIQGQAY